MTHEEYLEKKKQLESEHAEQLVFLAKKYAFSNNTVLVGDTVTDHIGSIIVEKIKFSQGSFGKPPECVYFGTSLKKDGKPFESGEKRAAYQSNLVS